MGAIGPYAQTFDPSFILSQTAFRFDTDLYHSSLTEPTGENVFIVLENVKSE